MLRDYTKFGRTWERPVLQSSAYLANSIRDISGIKDDLLAYAEEWGLKIGRVYDRQAVGLISTCEESVEPRREPLMLSLWRGRLFNPLPEDLERALQAHVKRALARARAEGQISSSGGHQVIHFNEEEKRRGVQLNNQLLGVVDTVGLAVSVENGHPLSGEIRDCLAAVWGIEAHDKSATNRSAQKWVYSLGAPFERSQDLQTYEQMLFPDMKAASF